MLVTCKWAISNFFI